MEPLVIDWTKEEGTMAKIIQYIYLLLIIQFLSRLCNIFLARSKAPKEYYLMINSEKIHFTVFKISVKMQI